LMLWQSLKMIQMNYRSSSGHLGVSLRFLGTLVAENYSWRWVIFLDNSNDWTWFWLWTLSVQAQQADIHIVTAIYLTCSNIANNCYIFTGKNSTDSQECPLQYFGQKNSIAMQQNSRRYRQYGHVGHTQTLNFQLATNASGLIMMTSIMKNIEHIFRQIDCFVINLLTVKLNNTFPINLFMITVINKLK
jgi:hypothetical protein